jgi:serine/threonine-protein kinase
MLAQGTVLRNRYKILQPVGQGGMGSVYLAEDNRLEGRKCAVKAVRLDPNADQDTINELQHQFSREASVLARLDHPNLPKVSDYFNENGHDYLVMDFVSGKDLKILMDEARRTDRFLAEAEVLEWARQLCDALEYMHAQETPVLHRDIKPSNIKLTPSGFIKLVDFGLVKLLSKDYSQTITVLQGRGTAAYTPLEQYGEDDTHTDVRSDIYALGATLYHLLTNQTPAEAKQRFLKPQSLQRPKELNPGISDAVERAILAAIEMHPDDRPASVPELRNLLLAGANAKTTTKRLMAASQASYWLGQKRRAEFIQAMRDNAVWLVLAGTSFVVAALASLVR